METIRAWGCVLRRSLQNSMRGNARSSANFVAPVTFAAASTLRSAFPITRRLSAIERLGRGFCFFPPHPGGCELHRLVDLDVAGAAAEVAGERILDLVTCRLRIGGEQGFSGQQERRGTRDPARGRKAPVFRRVTPCTCRTRPARSHASFPSARDPPAAPQAASCAARRRSRSARRFRQAR